MHYDLVAFKVTAAAASDETRCEQWDKHFCEFAFSYSLFVCLYQRQHNTVFMAEGSLADPLSKINVTTSYENEASYDLVAFKVTAAAASTRHDVNNGANIFVNSLFYTLIPLINLEVGLNV